MGDLNMLQSLYVQPFCLWPHENPWSNTSQKKGINFGGKLSITPIFCTLFGVQSTFFSKYNLSWYLWKLRKANSRMTPAWIFRSYNHHLIYEQMAVCHLNWKEVQWPGQFCYKVLHFFRFKNWCKITSQEKSDIGAKLRYAGGQIASLKKNAFFRRKKALFQKAHFIKPAWKAWGCKSCLTSLP